MFTKGCWLIDKSRCLKVDFCKKKVKEVLENVGALEKAVKLNNGFIDRLCNGLSLSEEYKQIIRDARQELSETRNIQVIKPCR